MFIENNFPEKMNWSKQSADPNIALFTWTYSHILHLKNHIISWFLLKWEHVIKQEKIELKKFAILQVLPIIKKKKN